MSIRLSSELRLAGACCRWPRSDEGAAAIRSAAVARIDWQRFARIVARNRISGLVGEALESADVTIPPDVGARLAQKGRLAAVNSLAQARESARLQRAFDAEGLPALILKGAPLAMLAYGDLGRKESLDIDLLIAPEAVAPACKLLSGLGYRIVTPSGLDEGQFGRWVCHSKEASFLHPDSRILVDLHWRLVDNRQLLSGVGLASETQVVALGSGSVRTLADKPLFAYLCVHGSGHNWARLKWLADLGAFLDSRSPHEVETLYHAADAYGAGRSARFALLLCERLIGTRFSPALRAEIGRDPIAGALARGALAALDYRKSQGEHRRFTMPWLSALAGPLFIGDGVRPMVRQFTLLWTSKEDRARIDLPERLGFLHHFMRIPLWLLRIARRGGTARHGWQR